MCSEIFMFFVIFLIAISVTRVPTTVQMQLDRFARQLYLYVCMYVCAL